MFSLLDFRFYQLLARFNHGLVGWGHLVHLLFVCPCGVAESVEVIFELAALNFALIRHICRAIESHPAWLRVAVAFSEFVILLGKHLTCSPRLVDVILFLPSHHLFSVEQTAVIHLVDGLGDFLGIVPLDCHFLQAFLFFIQLAEVDRDVFFRQPWKLCFL